MSLRKVFITGATGYIGGEVLYKLLNGDEKFDITALVRSQAKSDKLLAGTENKISTVIGNLDDASVIKQQVENADIIINTADVDHVPSAELLSKVLVAKRAPTTLIHTSGTSVIGDDLSATKSRSTKVYSDSKSIDELNSLPYSQPHRPVDEIILNIQKQNPLIATVIVCPSTIFGLSHGYDKINSVQVPYLVELSLKRGKSFSVFSGDYIWNHIHIHDLGTLYELILKKLLKDPSSIPTGREGYYFGSYTFNEEEVVSAEPSSIEHIWYDVSKAVGESLFKRKLISSPEVDQLSADEIVKFSESEFAPFYWGSNSRSRADNGYKIGWKPIYSDSKYFWASIDEDIDHLLNKK